MNLRKSKNYLEVGLLGGIIGQLGIYGYLYAYLLHMPSLAGIDFIIFYTAGRIVRQGTLNALYDLTLQQSIQGDVVGAGFLAGQALPFNHPPFLVPLLGILAGDNYRGAFLLWSFVLLSALLLVAYISVRFLQRTGWSLRIRWGCILNGILFGPIFVSLLKGQDTVFVLLPLLIWIWAIDRNRDALAGGMLALTALRPQITLMLAAPFLLARPKARWPFLGTMGGLGLYSFSLIGAQGVWDFLRMLHITVQGLGYGINTAAMYNLAGFVVRNLDILSPGVQKSLIWAGYFLTLAILSICYSRRVKPQLEDWGIVIVVALFFAPHLHFHDLGLLFVPLLILITRLIQRCRWSPFRVWLLCLLGAMPLAMSHLWSIAPHILFSVLMLALMIELARLRVSQSKGELLL